ncbi:MAG: Nuclease precursor [Verrucomicrobiota bacterium]|jgi:endonuclease G
MIRNLLRFLGWVCLLVLLATGLLGLVYYLAERPAKVAIEQRVLDAVDTVREDGTTPRTVVDALDQFADRTVVVTGDIVPAPPPAAQATAPYGEPADRVGLKRLVNRGYTVGYDDRLPSPRWSSYRVFPCPEVHRERPSGFRSDSRTMARVTTSEYVRSGYDRGHLAPNYAISVCHGEEAQKETFLLSNIVPQLHALNAGLWKDMEQRIMKRYVARYGTVWVQVGPVFPDPPDRRFGRIPVPTAFWMVISEYDEAARGVRAIAYLVPHEEKWRDVELTRYVVSIRRVEELTGLDFFPQLPAAAQQRLESAPAPRAW